MRRKFHKLHVNGAEQGRLQQGDDGKHFSTNLRKNRKGETENGKRAKLTINKMDIDMDIQYEDIDIFYQWGNGGSYDQFMRSPKLNCVANSLVFRSSLSEVFVYACSNDICMSCREMAVSA